jgi:hypothetical protein
MDQAMAGQRQIRADFVEGELRPELHIQELESHGIPLNKKRKSHVSSKPLSSFGLPNWPGTSLSLNNRLGILEFMKYLGSEANCRISVQMVAWQFGPQCGPGMLTASSHWSGSRFMSALIALSNYMQLLVPQELDASSSKWIKMDQLCS